MTEEKQKYKIELQNQCDDKGIEYDKRIGIERLRELLNGVQKEPENEENSSPDGVGEQDSNLESKDEVNSTVQELRKSVIIATGDFKKKEEKKKAQVYTKKYNPVVKHEINGAIEIYDKVTNEFIRVYNEQDQGKDYKQLADQFVAKRNRY